MTPVHIVLMATLVIPGQPPQKSPMPMASVEQCVTSLADLLGNPPEGLPKGTIVAAACIYTIPEQIEN